MESLALIVSLIFFSVFLCGPLAVMLSYAKLPLLALLVGGVAVFLGIYWFGTVTTSIKYLGVVSALMGLWALLKTTGEMFP